MSCSAEFWHTFWPTLGVVVAILPAIIVFWSSFGFWIYWQSREDRRVSATDARLGPRVAYLEGRLLPFEEARHQRSS